MKYLTPLLEDLASSPPPTLLRGSSRRIVRDRIKSLEAIGMVTNRRSGKRHKYMLKIA
jgi:hypothetical protein